MTLQDKNSIVTPSMSDSLHSAQLDENGSAMKTQSRASQFDYLKYDTKLILANESSDPIVEALGQLYDIELWDAGRAEQSRQPPVAAFVMDCAGKGKEDYEADRACVDKWLDAGISLVLLNVLDSEYMAQLCGVGFKTGAVIVRPYAKKTKIIDVLDYEVGQREPVTNFVKVTQDEVTSEQRAVIAHPDVDIDMSPLSISYPFAALSSTIQARAIEAKLNADDAYQDIEALIQSRDSESGNLPAGQVMTSYVKIGFALTLDNVQRFSNGVVMEVSLIASYDDPPYKYLRITSLGAGFHPANGGNIYWDEKYDRGIFQSNINIFMEAMDDELSTLAHSPSNVNNQSQYTTTSSLTVGVDISKNPGFNGSYTVRNSETENISDFDIVNQTSGRTGSWNFELGLTKKSVWDIFEKHFIRKAEVKSLPTLAKSNLQPRTTITWYAPNSYNGMAPLQLNWAALYYRCYVTGNFLNYTMLAVPYSLRWGYKQDNPFCVNFAKVNPDGGS